MQTFVLTVTIIGLSVVLSVVGLWWVHHAFPAEIRKENNEVAGFFIAVLGVIYAVLMAFIVIVQWQEFDSAQNGVDHEGNARGVTIRDLGLGGAGLEVSEPDPSRPSED